MRDQEHAGRCARAVLARGRLARARQRTHEQEAIGRAAHQRTAREQQRQEGGQRAGHDQPRPRHQHRQADQRGAPRREPADRLLHRRAGQDHEADSDRPHARIARRGQRGGDRGDGDTRDPPGREHAEGPRDGAAREGRHTQPGHTFMRATVGQAQHHDREHRAGGNVQPEGNGWLGLAQQPHRDQREQRAGAIGPRGGEGRHARGLAPGLRSTGELRRPGGGPARDQADGEPLQHPRDAERNQPRRDHQRQRGQPRQQQAGQHAGLAPDPVGQPAEQRRGDDQRRGIGDEGRGEPRRTAAVARGVGGEQRHGERGGEADREDRSADPDDACIDGHGRRIGRGAVRVNA